MKLLIETPAGYEAERGYVLDIVLRHFLGINYEHRVTGRNDVRITQQGLNAKSIHISDTFFKVPAKDWLSRRSLPSVPLQYVDLNQLGVPVKTTSNLLPVLYGDQHNSINFDTNSINLPIDIFGSSFFMLSRYEEALSEELPGDAHSRFPAAASVAVQAGFLDRPIVDEYTELLWSAIKIHWPSLSRKNRQFELAVSHDVDRPSRYAFNSPRRFVGALIGDAIDKRFSSLLSSPAILLRSTKSLHPTDPYNTFSWLMDQSERAGIKSAFYFISGTTDPKRDSGYTMGDNAIRSLLKDINNRGHEIGLHPSYNTYLKPAAIASEFAVLRSTCAAVGIEQETWGGRMHYLRWKHSVTCAAWEAAGLSYDGTLGFANEIGFRCGTCHSYPAFNLQTKRRMDLILKPLIAMDQTVMSPSYMGLGYGQSAADALNAAKSTCKLFDGTFTLLWHNSELDCPGKKELYSCLL